MTLAAYTATTAWCFPLLDDPRGYVTGGSIIILDDVEAATALAQGSVSATPPTLTEDQIATLATAQACSYSRLGSRAPLIGLMGLWP